MGHWTILSFSTQSSIVSSILSNATGVEQNGLQGEIVGTTFEVQKVPEALASVSNAFNRGFCRLAPRAIDAGVQYGTGEFKQNVCKSHRQVDKS